jgi:hypothetical protein
MMGLITFFLFTERVQNGVKEILTFLNSPDSHSRKLGDGVRRDRLSG